MSKKEHVSATPATMWLKQHKVPFEDGIYEYVEHGGTAQAAACFGVDEHNVVKTLIMQDEHEKPLVILMHGDREVSTKNLARQTNRKHIEPCKPQSPKKIPAIKSGEPRRSVQRRTCRSTSKKQFWVCRLFISTAAGAVITSRLIRKC